MPIVKVDAEKCTGCGQCVDTCPVSVFELVDGKAVPKNADDCIACHACESACPTGAITIED